MEVKITMVEIVRRNIDAKVMYFSYRVARLCIIDSVDLVDPERINAIFILIYLFLFKVLLSPSTCLTVSIGLYLVNLFEVYLFTFYFMVTHLFANHNENQRTRRQTNFFF